MDKIENNGLLFHEYAEEAVPLSARKPIWQVAAIWMGFTLAASLAVLGGIVQAGVGVQTAIYAVIAGNCLLFVYANLLGFISLKTGLNFPLVAKKTFGSSGFVIASFILSILVLGWFAVQADMFGVLLNKTLMPEIPRSVITLVCSLVFISTALLGYRAMVWLSYLVIPSFLGFGSYAAYVAFSQTNLDMTYVPAGASMGVGTAISIVAGSFIVSATMTGDFVRWNRSVGAMIVVHFLAFVVGLSATMLFGVFLSASGKETDIFTTLIVLGLAIPGALMTGINLWSTCDNCLYNASLGFTNQLAAISSRTFSQKRIIVVVGILGATIAAFGAFGKYEQWLIFLGTVVPPAGGVIIADFYAIRWDKRSSLTDLAIPQFRVSAFIGWALGIIVAVYAESQYPNIPAAYVGVFVGGIVHLFFRGILQQNKNIQNGLKN